MKRPRHPHYRPDIRAATSWRVQRFYRSATMLADDDSRLWLQPSCACCRGGGGARLEADTVTYSVGDCVVVGYPRPSGSGLDPVALLQIQALFEVCRP